jgi:hypothetical protein
VIFFSRKFWFIFVLEISCRSISRTGGLSPKPGPTGLLFLQDRPGPGPPGLAKKVSPARPGFAGLARKIGLAWPGPSAPLQAANNSSWSKRITFPFVNAYWLCFLKTPKRGNANGDSDSEFLKKGKRKKSGH